MKRSNFLFSVLLGLAMLTFSCGGDSDPVNQGPSNLVVEAILSGANTSNPNGDGSGTVTFTFSANNASRYLINFGDDETTETTGNSVTHTYVGGGLRTFTVYVSAYSGQDFISQTLTVTIRINSGLVWSDEFDGSGAVNSTKWKHEIGGGGWGNDEKQYYTDRQANSKVENGWLIITAKKETYENREYTSARLITHGKFEFTYGRVDIRAKLPEGNGTWPALWMLGSSFFETNGGWPSCGEIDIMEHWGHVPEEVSSAIHTDACSSMNGCSNQRVGSTMISDYATTPHVYSMEWDEDEIRFYIDDQYKYKYRPSTKTSENWPFNKPQFLIMNVAMGGGWFEIDPNFTSSTMEIDYVRVYQ